MRSGKLQSKEKRLKGEYNTKRKKKEGERPVKSAPSFCVKTVIIFHLM